MTSTTYQISDWPALDAAVRKLEFVATSAGFTLVEPPQLGGFNAAANIRARLHTMAIVRWRLTRANRLMAFDFAVKSYEAQGYGPKQSMGEALRSINCAANLSIDQDLVSSDDDWLDLMLKAADRRCIESMLVRASRASYAAMPALAHKLGLVTEKQAEKSRLAAMGAGMVYCAEIGLPPVPDGRPTPTGSDIPLVDAMVGDAAQYLAERMTKSVT